MQTMAITAKRLRAVARNPTVYKQLQRCQANLARLTGARM